jgi:protein-S-isoprenylcysteine O-methyltransferase Ste14
MTIQQADSSIRLIIAFIVGVGLFAAIIFWPAGRIDWVMGWLYLGLVTANLVVGVVYLRRVNPELIEHRLRWGKGTKLWDKIWATLFTPVFLAIHIIAGLDAVRFEWSTMSGPYNFVRHPGYLGFFGWNLSAPMLLGSWWAFIPAVLSVISIVIRTALEDRTLRAELDGYEEYVRRIRYRLIPGVW